MSVATPRDDRPGLTPRDLAERFELASARAGGTIERAYRIGDRGLRLRFAGEAMYERFAPSLAHLAVDGVDVDQEIGIWDGASTRTAAPPQPRGSEHLPPGGIAIGGDRTWRAIYEVDVRTLSVLDYTTNSSWYWATDAELLPEWSCSTPLRHILHLRLASLGVQFVHAGAVGRPSGGFIVVGRSGSGKSTTTLSTLGTDLLWAGDDYVGVSLDPDGSPRAHSIYGCAKLETGHLSRFPELRFMARPERPGAPPAWREKTIFYVRDTYPRQVTTGFPLKGIIVPRVCPDEPTAMRELPLSAALRALVPSTMFEIHGSGQQALSTLTRVAQRVRTLELRLGRGMEEIPELIDRALDDSS